MKQYYFIVWAFMLLTIVACTGQATTDKPNVDVPPAKTTVPTEPSNLTSETTPSAADNSALSPDFIAAVQAAQIKDLEVKGNKLMKEGSEIDFPVHPKAQSGVTVLKGDKDGWKVTLKVERINPASIKYDVRMEQEGKATHSNSGIATILPTFYLAQESDKSDLSGNSYTVAEYIMEDGSCYTSIRLGKETEGGVLLGKLIKDCNEEFPATDLESYPTLVAE